MTNPIRNFIYMSVTVLCLSSGNAAAGQLDLIVNGFSYHVNSDYDWNEENYGLGLEYQFDTSSRWIWSATGNAFMDSQENMSYMAGGGLKRRLFQSEHRAGFYVDVGLVAFLMARADIDDYRPFPGVLPTLSFGMKNAGVNLTYLPRAAVQNIANARIVDEGVSGVFFLQFKFRLPRRGQ